MFSTTGTRSRRRERRRWQCRGWGRLELRLARGKLSVKRGKPVHVRFSVTLPVRARLDVFRGKRRIGRVRGHAGPGTGRLTWKARIGRRAARPGRYRLRLTVAGGGGVQTGNVRLDIR